MTKLRLHIFRWLGGLLVIAATFLMVACGGRSQPVGGNVLFIGNGGEPRDLDPQTVTGVPEIRILTSLLEGLVAHHPSDDRYPEPGVAERWEVCEEGRVWTFHLREDARWSNGDPVTARDFVFSWRRIVEPALACEYADWMYLVENGEAFHRGEIDDFDQVGLRALDDRTFEVTLVAPTADFLQIILHHAFLPVHPPTIERFGGIDVRASGWTQPASFVGNGPFQLTEWRPNTVISVERNPYYWDAATVRLDGIRFFPIDDENTEERAFRTGQLHITSSVPANMRERYQRDHPQYIRFDPQAAVYFYRLNTLRPPLDNRLLREALSLAINRDMLVRQVTRGGETPAHAIVPPGTGGYTPPNRIRHDPERAHELMSEAGFPGGRGLPPLELLFNTSDNHRRIAEAIQQMWQSTLGVQVTLVNQEWQVYLNTTQNMNYMISRAGWVGNIYPYAFLRIYLSESANNQTGFASERYDELMRQARHTMDDEKRFALLYEAEDLLLSEFAVIPIYWYTNVFLINPAVRNWNPKLIDLRPYKYVELVWDEAAS